MPRTAAHVVANGACGDVGRSFPVLGVGGHVNLRAKTQRGCHGADRQPQVAGGAHRHGVLAKQRARLENALREAKALLRMINDILDLAKIEAGKLNIEFTEFGLRQTLDEVLQELAVRARDGRWRVRSMY